MEHRQVSDLVYLYGFVPSDAPVPGDELRGIDDSAVELIDLGPVRAVLSRLPAERYRADILEARLQDLAWVGTQGLAHERVVLWFVDHSEIVPARLFSLYAGAASLAGAIGPRAADIAATLGRFAGLREWNLKIAYNAEELGRHGADISDELRALDQEMATAAPGRRYLLAKRRGDILKREVARSARRLANDLLERLARHAQDSRTLPLASVDATGAVVLSAALLVRREEEAALQQHAEQQTTELARLGLLIDFSGPWAPYRFLDEDADA